MLLYILKFSACLAILLLFYKLFLERESIHVFKRFYLLTALVFSLVIPALVFTEYVEALPGTDNLVQPMPASSEGLDVPPALEADILDFAPLLWGVYFLGLIFFGLKFVKNLFQIFRRIRNNPKQRAASFVRVLLRESFPPHTFFKYVFLNKLKFETNEIPKEVLLHEETHAKQKHSMDVLFIELLQIAMWFNPLIYFTRRSIKLNHEFLADKAVLKKGVNPSTYQNTLLSFMTPIHHQSLANAINYSSIKKRFTVMKTKTSKRSVWVKIFILIPLTTLLLLGFSTTEIRYKEVTNSIPENENLTVKPFKFPYLLEDSKFLDTYEEQRGASKAQFDKYNELAKKYNAQPIATRTIPLSDLKTLETIYKKLSPAQKDRAMAFPECPPQKVISQDGASRKLMAEYNKLAKHYNNMSQQRMRIQMKDVERLEYIYSLMSEKQKADAEPFPDFPPIPDPPPPPVPEMAVVAPGSDLKGALAPVRSVSPSPNNSGVPAPSHPQAPTVLAQAGTESTPPPVPQLAVFKDRGEYPDHIQTAIDKYLKMANNYRNAVTKYNRNKKGNAQELESKYRKTMELYNNYEDLARKENLLITPVPRYPKKVQSHETNAVSSATPPLAPHVPVIAGAESVPSPPPPPPPKSPLEFVKEMAKKNADFYYNGEKISSAKAIEILENTDHISLKASHTNLKRPKVELSDEPIVIE